MSLSIMGNLRKPSNQFAPRSPVIVYVHMYVGRMSKRVMTVLNHLGIQVSSSGVHTATNTMGKYLARGPRNESNGVHRCVSEKRFNQHYAHDV